MNWIVLKKISTDLHILANLYFFCVTIEGIFIRECETVVFSSVVFVSVFLPIVFLLHWLLPDIRIKNALLILASLSFYAYGEPVYVLLMIGSVFVNYLLGIMCDSGKRYRKLSLLLAIIWNIGLLVIFKYAGFLVQLWNSTGLFTLPIPDIRLPIGISFFTFQALSYVIDVYRRTSGAQKNFFRVLLYISFFPQLIAGPIVKYHDIALEIDNRRVTLEGSACGMRRFAAGLSKKVLVANILGLTADTLFAADPGSINIVTAWIAAVSYLLQIYFDFSGYSDMALGMGEMFGFHFKENFNYPYIAENIRDFWRRWHMSLSGWFRDYLYIPLGGNRKGRLRTVFNKFFVFFCTGLWHGANSTFVVWGLYHGFFLMMEEYLPVWSGKKAEHKRRYKEKDESLCLHIFRHIYTILVVTVGFVIFRGENLAQGLFFIKEMFTGFHFEPMAMSLAMQQLTPLYLTVLLISVFACCPWKVWIIEKISVKKISKSSQNGMAEKASDRKNMYDCLTWIASAAGLVLCMLSLSGSTYNPFIYFRF